VPVGGDAGAPGGELTAELDGPQDGPLVVLLHGFPQTRHTWRAQVPALAAAGFRAVAPDQRGYSAGLRPDPADLAAYAIDCLVADVLALADAVAGPGARFHLVGHDWGGAVAWATADRHPDRLHTLTVLSRPHPAAFAAAMAADADGQRHRSRHHRAFHDPATAGLLLEDGARRLRRSFADQGVPEAHVEEYLGVLGDRRALEAALAWYRAAGALARLTAGPITVPTTYVWGDADATVGPAAAGATAEHVTADYRFVVVPGGGHFLTDDHPDDVTAAVLDRVSSPA
jgi:pimeloyl-ACP methyl ester carboxylesterase